MKSDLHRQRVWGTIVFVAWRVGSTLAFAGLLGFNDHPNPGPMVGRRKRAGLCALGPEWCHRARKALSRYRLGGQLCHTGSSLNQLV